MNKKTLAILLSIVIYSVSYSQDFLFSQYYAAQPYLNPAMTGFFDGSYRVNAQFRNQWGTLGNGGINTYGINADFKLGEEKLNGSYFGLGVGFYRDDYYRVMSYNTGRINFSYTLKMGQRYQSFLSFGTNFGMDYKQLSDKEFTTPDAIPELPQTQNKFIPNLGLGLNYQLVFPSFANVFFGVSADHLVSNNVSFYNQNYENPMKFTVYTSAKLESAENINLLPTFLYAQQDNQRQISFGIAAQILMADYNNNNANLQAGVYTRVGNNALDAIIPMIRYEISGFQVGVSYDINVSELNSVTHTYGGIEATVGYIGLLPSSKITRLNCPNIKNF